LNRVVRYLLSIFICILIIVPLPSITSACSCAKLPTVEDGFQHSKAVFSGKVIDIKDKKTIQGYMSKSVLFEVSNTWKGVEQSQIMITTGQGGGDCGFDFKEGKEYLVYANDSTMYGAESLVSIICDRTNELNSSKEDLGILGQGKPPIEKVDLSGKQNVNPIYIWVLVFIVIGIFLTWIIRKKQ